MNVQVLYTDGCPNARPVLRRMKELAHHREELTLTMVEVIPGQAVPEGFTGSPTVLIDGANPFGGSAVDSAACSLHPPTVDQVEAALRLG